MKAAWALYGLGFLIIIGAAMYLVTKGTEPAQKPLPTDTMARMTVRSPAFNHEEFIPSKYTCDGEDLSPPLAIDNIPAGAASLVLIVDDPDAPGGTWDHWIVFNIPGKLTRIGEGDAPEGLEGTNSWGRGGYGGPCPPSGTHRYLFKIYALDTTLDVPLGARKTEVLAAMEGHVLESATLMGRYQRMN